MSKAQKWQKVIRCNTSSTLSFAVNGFGCAPRAKRHAPTGNDIITEMKFEQSTQMKTKVNLQIERESERKRERELRVIFVLFGKSVRVRESLYV